MMRKLQKIALDLPSNAPGKPIVLDWLPLSELRVDSTYQRETGRKGDAHVKRIASRFRWKKFSPVIVTDTGHGYAIIDGQHRCTAALSLGYDRVPCAIVEASPSEAADIFAAVNGETIRMNVMALFKAALAAKVQWAVDVSAACKAAGVNPLTHPVPSQNQRPGDTNAIGRLRRIAEIHGRDGLEAVLRLVMASPHANIPGYINSAAIDGEFQRLSSVRGWNLNPGSAADRLIADAPQEPIKSSGAPLVVTPHSGNLAVVNDEPAAIRRIQELKARGFTKSMVSAVTKFRHSIVEKYWDHEEAGK